MTLAADLAALRAAPRTDAAALATALVARHPREPDAWLAAGGAALDAGDPAAAIDRVVRALKLDSQHPRAWQDLGRVYLALGQPAEAERAYYRAVHVTPRDAAAWTGLGVAQDGIAEHRDAVVSYGKAREIEGDAGDAALALASALLAGGDAAAAEATARSARAARNATDAASALVLAHVLSATGRDGDAAAVLAQAAVPGADARVHHNLGLALDAAGDPAGAQRAFEAALAAAPDSGETLAQLVHLKRRGCDWDGLDALSRRLRDAVRDGVEGVTPFSFLAEPASAAEQLRCARIRAAGVARAVAPLADRFPPRRASAAANVRVGFVSSGFNSHPTALLTVELFERLRAQGVTTLGFATAPDDGTPLRQRVARAFDRFVALDGLPAPAMAERIRDAQVDVLFDLRGYGGGAVSEVFALRAAPVQVNWLAYPGTSGAPFIDWLVADRVVVPDGQREHYSEAIARLPHCFQPSDTTRSVPTAPSRAACGLPDAGPVLASFNNAYKIAPDAFACWMRILAAVPDATLWLLDGADPRMAGNLRAAASAAGVDPARLRFMPKQPHADYLARYAHVDLFLDTWPYGAHTTASDALWAGCPVLTLPGGTFASRVAASLLATLGFPELVARDADDYVATAVRFATDTPGRQALRARLADARRASPLFDMGRFAADFARLVRAMAARSAQGLAPADIA